ncbi:uncharacterized protein LOC135397587 [Ornithodoros turicata]|uniref:uncharacterized protein LOC135397587 n=1 Tax=Ornithodoros turicata TaxID=34597 RepID=UPI003138DC96
MEELRVPSVMLLWILFASVICVVWAASASTSSCQNEDVSDCVKRLNLLSKNRSIVFASTEAELTTVCQHLTEAIECVNGFTERCFNSKQRDIYKRLTSGAAQLIDDFCREGSQFRKTYLKHSKCYKLLQEEYNRCAETYMEQQAEMQRQVLSSQDKVRNSCCQLDGYKQCTKTAVLNHCNAEAAELAEDIIVKAGGHLVSAHCAGYKIDGPKCNGCGKFMPGNLVSLSLLLVLLKLCYRTRLT